MSMSVNVRSAAKDRIMEYVQSQLGGEAVEHAELIRTDAVLGQAHETWNVVTAKGRWWVVTEPTNLYTQNDFRSADVVLTFHVGLMARLASRDEVPVTGEAASAFTEVWRRWEHAVETLNTAAEAEDFQAVGMRLRETYVALLKAVQDAALVPEGDEPPQDANPQWMELLGNHLAAGSSASRLRSYLKNIGAETWAHVNWLTHSSNAVRMDAEIAVANVSHLVAVFTAAIMRWQRGPQIRCAECGSYRMRIGDCERCGWRDPEYVMPELPSFDEMELARRSEEPCTPSSDISTFDGPANYRRRD